MYGHPRPEGPPSGGVPEGWSEAGVPAAAYATSSREVRKPPLGHYDPGARSSLHDGPEEMLGHGSAEPHQKIAGGAPRGARPRSQGGAGRLASAPARARNTCQGVSQTPAPLGAPPPLIGATVK